MLRRRSPPASSTLASAIGAILATSGGSVFAEERSQTLPKVTVQGELESAGGEPASPKYTAPLAETPQTISIVTSEVFTQQGARNLTDVLLNTPGITFNAGENGFSTGLSNFSMRGFDTSGSVFIDGVRDSGNYHRDVFNLEQVEIVKGPAGDSGRGSGGGYVNLISKTPHLEDSIAASVSAQFDEYDGDENFRGAIDANHAFSEGTALRVNAFGQNGGVPGRTVAEQKAWGIAPSLAFGLNRDTRFLVAYQHIEQDDTPDWGVPGAFIDGMLQYDPALNADSLRDNFYGLGSDRDDVRTDSILARVTHDFDADLTLTNQTRWAKADRKAVYTVPTGYTAATQTVATQVQGYERDNESISNQTSLRFGFATGAVRHQAAAGLELSREKSNALRFPTPANPGTGAPISVFDPNSNRSAAPALVATQASDVAIDSVIAYFYDTAALSERWDLTGGVQVERYTVDIESRTLAGAPQGPDGYSTTETTVGGKLGAVFKPTASTRLYGAVGVSALPPGSFLSNPDISREGDNAFPGWSTGLNREDAKVQRSINYELGAKWSSADEQLLLTAALFRTEKQNVAISGRDPRVTPLPPAQLLGYGEQIVQGLELGASGRITQAWSIFGGVAFMDSERQHSALLDEARRLANPADYGTATRTSGDELAFSPKVTGSLWTTYRLQSGLTVGGGVRHVGSSWLGRPDDAERIIPNGVAGKLPSYTVVDAIVSYDFNPRVSARLNVNNVTDELYAVSSNWNGARVTLGAPRSVSLSADIRF